MRILKFEADDFRNVRKASFSPSKGCNIFVGENAQGKTNLLEAISLFTGEKSFRRAQEKDLIRFGCDMTSLKVTFFSQGREQTAVLRFSSGENAPKKQIELNGVKKRSVSALSGSLCMVIFSPNVLSVINDGPEERRRLIDSAVTQLIPSYGKLQNTYQQVLFQRNNTLRSIEATKTGYELLDVWDERLARLGAKIVKLRRHYISRISPYAETHYAGISGEKEKIGFEYISTCGGGEEEFLQKLSDTRQKDVEQGFTSVGPHRDDLDILISKKSARVFGSQGQKRSAVLAMKLSEATVLEDKYGEPPVLLFDDVLSELDPSRQEYLISRLSHYQTFITCCEKHESLKGRMYEVSGGKIKLLRAKA